MESGQILYEEILGTQELESLNAFRDFEKRLFHVLENHLHEFAPTHILSLEEKQSIFNLLWRVGAVESAKENTNSTSELRSIDEAYHQILQKFRTRHEEKEMVLQDYNILAAFYHVLYHGIKSRKRTLYLKKSFAIPIQEGVSMLKSVPNMYIVCFLMLISRLNDLSKHYYSFDMLRSDGQGQLNMTLTPILSIYLARQESMLIHRAFRSVYKLATTPYSSGIKWLEIPKEKLGNHYKGVETNLQVYIQAHALTRLKERLDVFDQISLNDILNSNLRQIKLFEHFKGNLLLPIQVSHVKVGYLMCNVVADRIVARTFRFLTHNSTPEGDKLLETRNRLNSDIRYCIADKLSDLFKVEDELSLRLYYEAGLSDLFQLKNYNLNIDAMQDANYEEFLSYIKQRDEAEFNVPSFNHEESGLMNYSLGKLLKLLFLNTLGLIVALFFKTFYFSAHKIKGSRKLNVDLNTRDKKPDLKNHSKGKGMIKNEFDFMHEEYENYEEQVN